MKLLNIFTKISEEFTKNNLSDQVWSHDRSHDDSELCWPFTISNNWVCTWTMEMLYLIRGPVIK